MTARLARAAAAILILCAALVSALPAIAQTRQANAPVWSYSGANGPDHWSDLDPAFTACKTGQRQSPINIVGAQPAELAPIQFNYTLAPLKIINNGFTIQINYEPGSSITANGVVLPLVQFHFHHASENAINGQKYDMELHLVHMDPATNRAAVVAIFIKSGAENAPLRDLWKYIPRDKGKEEEHKKVLINPADLLPANQNYYVFDGSFSIPPCKENVTWYVMKTPIEASPAQIAAFARYYPDNARPLQAANGRAIRESNFH